MAHHKSTKKSIRQSKKRYGENKVYRTQLKNAIKDIKGLATDSDISIEEAQKKLNSAVSVTNHAKSKGIIPVGRAKRITSRLTIIINKKFKKANKVIGEK